MSRGIQLILVICFAFPLFGDERVSYIDLINSGKLTEAKKKLTLVVSDDSSKPLDKAIAYKHLGTTLFRLGENFDDAFALSEKTFKDVLRATSDNNAQQEYSLMLYQRANCLISACESDLSKSKLQGIPVVPFQLVKTYISPAQQALNDAKEHYPIGQMDDISLLYLELNLCEYHIWSIAGQNAMAAHAAQKALKTVEESKSNPMKPDARLKFAIRHATLLAETSDNNMESINQNLTIPLAISNWMLRRLPSGQN